MQSKNNAPTAAQKRWREAARELGSVISGGPAVIHHPVGVKGRHNKIDIGHWWVIPLTDEEHKALHNGERPWDGFLEGYADEPLPRKEFEKIAFDIVDAQLGLGDFIDESDLIWAAIMDYHK